MPGTWDLLQRELVSDNRRLIDHLRQLIAALEQHDGPTAQHIMRLLDRQFGPHIEFQERCLYPEVERCDGEAHATRLYEANEATIATLTQLQQADPLLPYWAASVPCWIARLRRGIDHAESCEQLLVYLGRLDAHRHGELLQRLRSLRKRGHRWSQLHPIRDV